MAERQILFSGTVMKSNKTYIDKTLNARRKKKWER